MRLTRPIRARSYDENGDCRGCGRALGWSTLPPKTSVIYQLVERHCRLNLGVVPTQAELCKTTGLARATMTEHFKILVEAGYLERQGDASKGRYELLRYSAAAAIRKVEGELRSHQVTIDALEQRLKGSVESAGQAENYEETISQQGVMIKALKERLRRYEPEARETRRENTHKEIEARARQAPQAGTAAPLGPGALEGHDDIPSA